MYQATKQTEKGELKAIHRAANKFPGAEIRTDSQQAQKLYAGHNKCTVTFVKVGVYLILIFYTLFRVTPNPTLGTKRRINWLTKKPNPFRHKKNNATN